MVWNKTENLQNQIIDIMNNTHMSKRTTEDHMNKFNSDMWVNLTWMCPGVRRAHLDVVDARDTKGLWMMHVCLMPEFDNTSPIFGLDIIAGKNKVTGAFLDYSPGSDYRNNMLDHFSSEVSKYGWTKKRELPRWALNIFSQHMVAAGNLKDDDELDSFINLSIDCLKYYIEECPKQQKRPEIYGHISQNNYCRNQKMNPHTPRVMKSLGLNENDVDFFIDKCLFPNT